MLGQVQVVPWLILEKKVGKKLTKGEVFTTKTGIWKVLLVASHDLDAYTVEQIDDRPV
jgi:hypothetical protein